MIREITNLGEVEQALAVDEALLYKHSPACWQSFAAERQVRRFAEQHPETPVYVVDVLSHRDLSHFLATHLQVAHESPQVVLLRKGRAAWSASHAGVRARAVIQALTDAA